MSASSAKQIKAGSYTAETLPPLTGGARQILKELRIELETEAHQKHSVEVKADTVRSSEKNGLGLYLVDKGGLE